MKDHYEILPCANEEQWHEKRIISGTVISAIMGRHRYVSRFKAFQMLTGRGDPFLGSYQTKRGTALEPVVADEAMDVLGKKFEQCGMTVYRTTDRPWETVTPDYVNHDEQLGMEIKTHGSKMAHILGQGPMDHQVDQCQWAMAILGWRMSYLVIAVDDDQPKIIPIERDEEWIKAARNAADAFYHDHVLPDTPPPADDSDDYADHLLEQHPHGEGERIEDDENSPLAQMIFLYNEVSTKIGALTKDKKLAGNQIREMLGDAKKGTTPIGSASWYDKKATTPWKKVAEQLRSHIDDNLWKQILAGVTKDGKVSRVLRVTYTGK